MAGRPSATATPDDLKATIDLLEELGSFPNRKALCNAVVASEWNQGLTIKLKQWSSVYNKMKEWGIKCKTPAVKGRGPAADYKEAVQAEIYRLEASATFANRTLLYEAFVAGDWNQNGPRFTVPTLYQRITKYGTEMVTEKGRRDGDFGRSRGVKPHQNKEAKRVSPEIIAKLRNAVPSYGDHEWSERNLAKIAEGSMKAKMQRKCMDCANFQREEIRHCGIDDCSLYSIRPFKTKEEKAALKGLEIVEA